MVDVGTKFSLLNKKTRAMQIVFVVMLVVGGLISLRIVTDFAAQYEAATGFGKAVTVFIPIITPALVVMLLVIPHRYVVTERGVRIESVLKRTSVEFNDVESVLLDIAPNQKKPFERVILSAKGKKHYLVGIVNDFEQLRDHIVGSVDSSIVDDQRNRVEIG